MAMGKRLMKKVRGCADVVRRAIVMVLTVAMVLPSLTWVPQVAYAEDEPAARVAQGFTLSLNWAKNDDASRYMWNATTSETRVVRLNVAYSNEGTTRAWAPGELEITVPGIGAALRGGTMRASDVAADDAGTAEKIHDWSYTWDSVSDTYTFTNNNEIEAGASFSGSFELLWEMSARNLRDGYNTRLTAHLDCDEGTVTSNAVSFSFASKTDEFKISGTYGAISSGDGLGEDGDSYIWVLYDLSSSMYTRARGAKTAQLDITAVPGARLAYVRNYYDTTLASTETGDGSWSVNLTGNLSYWYYVSSMSVLVGWPKDTCANVPTELQVGISGRYQDENEDATFCEAKISHVLDPGDFEFVYGGGTTGIFKDGADEFEFDDFTSGEYTTWYVDVYGGGTDHDVTARDDFQRVMLADGSWRYLADEEWNVDRVTIPSTSSVTNGNGFSYAAGEIQALVEVRMDGMDEWVEVGTYPVSASSRTVTLPEGNAGVAVTFLNVPESLIVESMAIRTSYSPDLGEEDSPLRIAENGSIRNIVAIENRGAGEDEVWNVPSRDSYTGTDRDEIADMDLATYGEYRQRGYAETKLVEAIVDSRVETLIEYGDVTATEDAYVSDLEVTTRMYNTGEPDEGSIMRQQVLLPAGMQVDEENFTAALELTGATYSDGTKLPSSWCSDHVSADVDSNWRDTGQTLVTLTWNMSDVPLTLGSTTYFMSTFGVMVSDEAYMEFGDVYGVDAVTTFDDETIDHTIVYPDYDDGSWSDLGEIAADVDEDGDTAEQVAPESETVSIVLAMASHREVAEKVMGERSNNKWEENATVALGEPYSYRLQMTTGITRAQDLVMYDCITDGGDWSGKLAGVDTSWLEGKGYSPVVYVSGDAGAAGRQNLDDGSWTEISAWDADLSGVKCVAVALMGQTVPEASLAYAVVNMDAPVDAALADKQSSDTYTCCFTPVDVVTQAEMEPVALESPAVTVDLVMNAGSLVIVKVDAVDGRRLAGAKFNLLNADGEVVAEGLVTNNQGKITVRDLAYGEYQLVETEAPGGYEVLSEPITFTIDETTEQVEVGDPRTTGTVTVRKVDAETGEALSGASFDVMRMQSDGTYTKIQSVTTGEDGTVKIEGLAWGQYRLVETECLGYQVSEEPVSVTISASSLAEGEEVEVTVENEQKDGTVTLTKYEQTTTGVDTGTVLKGAHYKIIDDEGATVKSGLISNDNGKIEVTGLAFGSYSFIETAAPTGYDLDETPIPFTLDRNNVDAGVQVTAKNKRTAGTVIISKRNDLGGYLQGAVFSVYTADDVLVADGLTTDERGQVTLGDLEWGDYYAVETKAPAGCVIDRSHHAFKIERGAAEVRLTVENDPVLGTVTMTKHEVAVDGTETGKVLAGATYELYTSTGTIVEKNLVTDDAGQITVSDLRCGDYYFVETIAPEGYELNKEHVEFTIDDGDNESATVSTTCETIDEQTPGTVRLYKDSDLGYMLQGVEFALYRADGTLVKDKLVTDQGGSISVEGLEWGDYYFLETKALEGFVLDETHYEFTIDHPEAAVEVDVTNQTQHGTVILKKVDAENNETMLSGAVFSLYQDDGTLVRENIETGQDGCATVEDLAWGSYYFQETKAPDGYSLSDKKVKFAVNAQNCETTQTVVAENEAATFSVSVTKKIDPDDIVWAHGDPTFTFELVRIGGGPDLDIRSGEDIDEDNTPDNPADLDTPADLLGKTSAYYQTVKFTQDMQPDEDGMLSVEVTFSGLKAGDSDSRPIFLRELNATRYGTTDITSESPAYFLPKNDAENIFEGESDCLIFKFGEFYEAGKNYHIGTFMNVKTDQEGLSDTGGVTNMIGRGRVVTSIVAEYDGHEIELEQGSDGTEFDGKGLNAVAYYDDGTSEQIVTDGVCADGASYEFDGLDASQSGTYALTVTYSHGGVTCTDTVMVPVKIIILDAYAILYTDGTMVFQRGDKADPDRGGEDAVVGKWTGFEEKRYSISSSVPWYSQRENVKTVLFEDEVKPVSTAFWFSNMSNATSMSLAKLNTSNVTDMASMFCYLPSLTTLNVSSFDTSAVLDMSNMFNSCSALTDLDLTSFDTSNVTDMEQMFIACRALINLTLSDGFKTKNVENMYNMFSSCNSLTALDLSSFDTSNVMDMTNMFYSCSKLAALDLSNFNTSQVTSMRGMFAYCKSFTTLDLSNFDTSSVTDMANMFTSCHELADLNLSNFDTSKVLKMNDMFANCISLTSLDLSNFITSSVTNMRQMFMSCRKLASIECSNWDTSNVTNMSLMFNGAPITTLDLSSWDTSNVTEMNRMFDGCSKLNTITYGSKFGAATELPKNTWYDIETGEQFTRETMNWRAGTYTTIEPEKPAYAILYDDGTMVFQRGDTADADRGGEDAVVDKWTEFETGSYGHWDYVPWASQRENVQSVLFEDEVKPTSTKYWFYSFTNVAAMDLAKLDTSKTVSMQQMFDCCRSLRALDLSNFNTSSVTDMFRMFAYCTNLVSIALPESFNTSKVSNMASMFESCTSLTTLTLPKSFDTSSVTSMSGMFSNCSKLTSLDLSNLDTSRVTNMQAMFRGCSSLTTLDLSNFNTSNVKTMTYMFRDCASLRTLDLSNFNVSKVYDMDSMFYGCQSLSDLNLSNWNTASVGYCAQMFSSCKSLTTLDLSGFRTSKITTMANMFLGCQSLTALDLSTFDTSRVESMACMFFNCGDLTSITFSNCFDTSNVTNMTLMFGGCLDLTSLTLPDTFDTSNVENMSSLFYNCRKLSIDCSSWDVTKVTNYGSFNYNAPGVIPPNWPSSRALSARQGLFLDKVFDGVSQDEGVVADPAGSVDVSSSDVVNEGTDDVVSMSAMDLVSEGLAVLSEVKGERVGFSLDEAMAA